MEKLINNLIAICFILFLICVILLAYFRTEQKVNQTIKKEVKITEQDTCNWCNIVKTYSLNVNSHHYGENTSK